MAAFGADDSEDENYEEADAAERNRDQPDAQGQGKVTFTPSYAPVFALRERNFGNFSKMENMHDM